MSKKLIKVIIHGVLSKKPYFKIEIFTDPDHLIPIDNIFDEMVKLSVW